eukprot:TRINITY_DN636_c0_g2_i1.p1 TRINITY_DN636_c0_g2~~TRINITY_DN636_c0_g2_i1.p1  ORF type:complete len:454 (-),score=90.49 TRINITY_DN636_c0_g2_i1:226-1587(-)
MDHAELTTEQVLKRDIPWEAYMTTKSISSTSLQLLRRYDHRPENVQASLLDEDGPAYVRVFVSILRDIMKEETVEYVLALIDEMLTANPKRARLFHDESLTSEDVYQTFLRLLSRGNWFIQEKSCKILTLIVSAKKVPYERNVSSGDQASGSKQVQGTTGDVLRGLVEWLCNQLRRPSHPTCGISTAISSLATLLRDPQGRSLFVKADGVKFLIPLLSPASAQQNVQLLYETTLCAWLLSFNESAVHALAAHRTLPSLLEVLKSSIKEKVVRVCVLTLKNLLSDEALASEMVELGLPFIVQSLKSQTWSDEDLVEALNYLDEGLKNSIRVLSSFDKYKQEVLRVNLDWSPMHKDVTFWRENVNKFEDNNFQILNILLTILDGSNDPRTLAVACHDIAQFIQFHPAGRGIVIDRQGKYKIMKLMDHESTEVRKNALICVQKLFLSAKYVSYLQP